MFSRIHQKTPDIHNGHIPFKFELHYSLHGLVLSGMVDIKVCFVIIPNFSYAVHIDQKTLGMLGVF